MGALSKQRNIEFTFSMDEFERRVGLISDYEELSWLGFNIDNFCGIFHPWRLAELLDFCRLNCDYHVVTGIGPGRYINRCVPDGGSYFLARGTKNPGLMVNYLLDPEWPLILEDGISAALAVFSDIKNRGD